MGTMIQARGSRRGRLPRRALRERTRTPLKGDNDLLVLTQPAHVVEPSTSASSPPAPTSSGRRSFNGNAISQADYGLSSDLARDQPRGRAARARRADAWSDTHARQAALRRGLDRADQHARSRSRPTSTTRATARSRWRRARATPTPSRRAACSTAASTCSARDDLRHAQREGRAVRDRARCSTERGARVPRDDLAARSPTHRAARSRARRSRRSTTRSATRTRCSVGLNCALGADADAAARRGARAPRRRRDVSALPERRPAERDGRLRRDARATWPALIGELGAQRLGQPRRRLLRHDARAHPRDRRRRARASAPRPLARAARRLTHFSGMEPLTIRPDIELPDDRRAHQRHRLARSSRGSIKDEQLRGGRRGRRASRCAAAPTSSTSTWTRACSTARRA